MTTEDNVRLKEYVTALSGQLRSEYTIDEKYFHGRNIKRGLRNSDGTGVLAGVSGIGSVMGYYMEDGVRVPQEGHLYYRGIDVAEIVDDHKNKNTFGYEEVAYLLLCGELPNREQKDLFNSALAEVKMLPEGFLRTSFSSRPARIS